MKTIVHKANSRGGADHGWLQTCHTFSFGNYYNSERMGFGMLRVLNDDVIGPGKGFGMHPHDNMEIITIPLEGDLEHKDSMGNVGVVSYKDTGLDVQVMSAGTGIVHSEYNKNEHIPVKLLQIWIMPNTRDVRPRYEQVSVSHEGYQSKLQQIVSPQDGDAPLWVHQNAWLCMGEFEKGNNVEYKIRLRGNGVYIFVINGSIEVFDHVLFARDGIGVYECDDQAVTVMTREHCHILFIDIPMK